MTNAAATAPRHVRADERLAELGIDPGMLEDYRRLLGVLDETPDVPGRVLALCRERVAALHGLAATPSDALDAPEVQALHRGEFAGFAASEQAALTLVDSLCFQPHAMEDADVQRCVEAFGAKGVVGLMTAIAFADVDCRLRLTLAVPGRNSP